MLCNLHVKNLALIDETEIDLSSGLNILTGETGAGKSILLGSVSLALGARYTADMLRNGAESGLVELTFSVDEGPLAEKMKAIGVSPEEGMITLTRKLMDGRSISRINGEAVSMGVLKEVAGMLIDIHGQHDNQSLLHKKNHLAFLDLYIGEELEPLKREMEKSYREYQQMCREEEQVILDEDSRRRELSLAEFEVNEIEQALLLPGEDEELEETYRRMSESRRITEAIGETYRFTAEDGSANASDCLSRAIRAFQDMSDFDETSSQLYGQLLNVDSLLNDFNRELCEYAKVFEFSEEEFAETESRLNLLNHLKAKYGKSVGDILAYCEEKKEIILRLRDYQTFLERLREKKEKAYSKTVRFAEKLHQIREKKAVLFSEAIRMHMTELNFLDTRLEIRVTVTGNLSNNGWDEAEFYLALNPGEPMKSLSGIASGGELSRIMLSIKTVLADVEDTPTLIFDEIDAGISGVTAGRVAEKLRLIGKSRQIICITHLPQIASAADVHFLIKKEASNNKVKTDIAALDEEESVKELARLLGGSTVTDQIIRSAREMKDMAKRET